MHPHRLENYTNKQTSHFHEAIEIENRSGHCCNEQTHTPIDTRWCAILNKRNYKTNTRTLQFQRRMKKGRMKKGCELHLDDISARGLRYFYNIFSNVLNFLKRFYQESF